MRAAIRRVAVVGGAVGSGWPSEDALRDLGYQLEARGSQGMLSLLRDLTRNRPAVLHARTAFLRLATLGRALGVSTVLQVPSGAESAVVAQAARLADRTLCGGALAREALIERGAAGARISIIRGLLELDALDHASKVQPAFLDPAFRWIVCAAPFDAERGHGDLLLAFLSLARRNSRLRLAFLGAPDTVLGKALLAQAAEAGLASRVVVRDLPRREIPATLVRAAVVVGPSRTGLLPDAVPEALALGATVVATAVGPHPLWVREGRTGFLVPPRAPVALAARLAHVLNDPDQARRVGLQARAAAVDQTAPRALAHELARCYSGVLRPGQVAGAAPASPPLGFQRA